MPLHMIEAGLRPGAAAEGGDDNVPRPSTLIAALGTATPTTGTTSRPAAADPPPAPHETLFQLLRQQDATMANVLRELEKSNARTRIGEEVRNGAARQNLRNAQLTCDALGDPVEAPELDDLLAYTPTAPSRGGFRGQPRNGNQTPPGFRPRRSIEEYPPNRFDELPAELVEKLRQCGLQPTDLDNPQSHYMKKGGPCIMCGEAHGTAWCPHAFICGTRFHSSRPENEKADYQAHRRARITFPGQSLQAMVQAGEEDPYDERSRFLEEEDEPTVLTSPQGSK
jgi:hypothetical protein